jgi:hypothetical protein
MWIALSEVMRESLPKLATSLEAEILDQREMVVIMRVQLVKGMKKPAGSIYIKYVT